MKSWIEILEKKKIFFTSTSLAFLGIRNGNLVGSKLSMHETVCLSINSNLTVLRELEGPDEDTAWIQMPRWWAVCSL